LRWNALFFGDETAAFRERIQNILLGTQQIVVNLAGIEYVDSGGLGTLVGMLGVNEEPAR